MKQVALALASLLVAVTGNAASFDCSKAGTKVEHMICDNPEISKLDEKLAHSYRSTIQDKSRLKVVKRAQRQWLKKRNSCRDESCLKLAYQKRIGELSSKPAETNASVSDISGEKYALVMSKNDDMCKHMRKLMNDDLNQFDRTYDSNDRFVSSHEEFKAIPWKSARASYESSGHVHYWNVEAALVDLNNDGALDFVVRDKSMLSGMRADSIDMLNASAAKHANDLTASELEASKNHIQLAGTGYPLSAPLAGRNESLWLLSPFVYHGITYLYMQSLYKRDEAIGGDFVVISKYSGGEFSLSKMTGKMKDICYIEREASKK